MRSIELFSGAGGLALAIHQAGFKHQLLVEADNDAYQTLEYNRENETVQGISTVDAGSDSTDNGLQHIFRRITLRKPAYLLGGLIAAILIVRFAHAETMAGNLVSRPFLLE